MKLNNYKGKRSHDIEFSSYYQTFQKKEGDCVMRKKTILALFALLILVGAFLAVSTLLRETVIDVSSNRSNKNFTENINLSVSILSNASQGGAISNVTFTWTLRRNSSIMLNNTIQNSSAGQTHFETNPFDTTQLPDGTYLVNVTVYNFSTEGNTTSALANEPWSTNLTIDNNAPNVSLDSTHSGTVFRPGVNDNTSSLKPAFLNATVTDTEVGASRLRNVSFSFSNASGVGFNLTLNFGTNRSTNNTWNVTYNLSLLRAGIQEVTVFAFDFAGKLNSTQSVTFTVNTPQNVTWITSNGSNFTASESLATFNITTTNNSFAPIYNVIFVFDNATGNGFNLSQPTGIFDTRLGVVSGDRLYYNVSYNVSKLVEGVHTVRVYTNDTMGNYNNTEIISFTVDKSAPSLSFSCSPSSPKVGDTVDCTCTASDGISGVKSGPVFQGDTDNVQSGLADSTGTKTTSTCSATDHAGNTRTATGSYTVSEAETAGTGSSGSGGGSSTGSAGDFSKRTWTSVNKGETAEVKVENGAIGVTSVKFAVKETAYGLWLSVTKKNSFPTTVKAFTKKTYRRLDISKGANLKEDNIEGATVSFKVEKSWLTSNGLNAGKIALFRYHNNKWVQLPTKVGEDDGTYVHFEATTPGFSYFVIGESEAPVASETGGAAEAGSGAVPGSEDTGAVEAPTGEGSEVSEGGSALIWLVPVIIAALALILWLVFQHRKR